MQVLLPQENGSRVFQSPHDFGIFVPESDP